jgi:alkanesulfonate monooxygenase SsuD/methylene tetrahydromethanopterin reductase-like flavin-dependent oxidoreductase (luciferase family)
VIDYGHDLQFGVFIALARAVASLDILSHGRAELGIGAGMAWDAADRAQS